MSMLPARRRPLLCLVLAAGALLVSVAPTAAAAPCPITDAGPTLQLLNAERAARGLRMLRFNTRLAAAAEVYSCDMVSRHFFAHVSPSGERLAARVAATGWLRGRREWALGEALAWGSGPLATPASIVAAWMRSPDHRKIVLHRQFHAIGIGIALSTPFGPDDGATFTADFGVGRRVRR